MTAPDRCSWDWLKGNWKLEPLEPRIKARAVFLIGPEAISQTENFIGIIQANGLGLTVGRASAGTTGNVNSISLPGGYHVVWTGMRVYKADGTLIHGVGFSPEVQVQLTQAGLEQGRDEVLEKGLNLLTPSS